MNNNQMKLFIVVAKTNDYSRLEYVGMRATINEEEALRNFIDKDRVTAIPVTEINGYTVSLTPKTESSVDGSSKTEPAVINAYIPKEIYFSDCTLKVPINKSGLKSDQSIEINIIVESNKKNNISDIGRD